mmetsp:Transcript_106763/g.319165  ORF Transcript_106763/g.319165 Transcript_106763/m.319165 type:complete len:203 (-) Transcript_106763:948-1556(-)
MVLHRWSVVFQFAREGAATTTSVGRPTRAIGATVPWCTRPTTRTRGSAGACRVRLRHGQASGTQSWKQPPGRWAFPRQRWHHRHLTRRASGRSPRIQSCGSLLHCRRCRTQLPRPRPRRPCPRRGLPRSRAWQTSIHRGRSRGARRRRRKCCGLRSPVHFSASRGEGAKTRSKRTSSSSSSSSKTRNRNWMRSRMNSSGGSS